MRSKIWTILTVLLVFSLLVAACGGADEPAPAAEPTAAPVVEAAPTEAPTAAPAPTDTPAPAPTEAPAAIKLGKVPKPNASMVAAPRAALPVSSVIASTLYTKPHGNQPHNMPKGSA